MVTDYFASSIRDRCTLAKSSIVFMHPGSFAPGHVTTGGAYALLFRPSEIPLEEAARSTHIAPNKTSSLLFRRRGLGLGGLLPVAADHDNAEERADDGGAQEDEDDGYADGPDARGEHVLKRVVRVDKGL